MKRVVKLATAISLLTSVRSLAQGCASCYTTAAAGGPQTAHALRSGIIFLLIPPVLIFSGVIISLWRWRNSSSNDSRPIFALNTPKVTFALQPAPAATEVPAERSAVP